MLPFSFQDTPGWERTNEEAADGSIEAIRWRGEQAEDGFSRFAFLASTPEAEGEIEWKAMQTYDDGHVVTLDRRGRFREPGGGHDRERLRARARTRVGRRRAAASRGASPAPTASAAAPASAPAEEDDDSPLPLILGIAALVISLSVALALAPQPAAV